MKTIKYDSFAKINLFLHILNKRSDSYHNLQTWFTFVDLKDNLIFSFNDSVEINISSSQSIGSKEDNLIYKAIKAFQNTYKIESVGVDVNLTKNIPMGAGLGGGSSNAATTLMAMRDYYRPDISNIEMITLATKLGADVPIFLYGRSAWAEGVGEILHQKDFKEQYVLLVKPNIHVSTKEFFSSKKLIKNEKILSNDMIYDPKSMSNVFERVFYDKYPLFEEYIKSLDTNFRMTGTGSCFFLLSQDEERLIEVARKFDKTLDKWVIKTLNYAY